MSIELDCARVPVVNHLEVLTLATPLVALAAARQAALARLDPETRTSRLSLEVPGGWMRVLSAVVPSKGIFGYKEFHLSPGGMVRYVVHLFAIDDGRHLGVIDAAPITTLRTAATAACAAVEYFGSTPKPLRVAVVGSGAEAQAGLRALVHALPIASATVVSRNADNRSAFARVMEAELAVGVRAVEDAAAAVAGADIVYLATNSAGRVVADEELLRETHLVLSIGSTMPNQRECNGDVLARADVLVIDTPDVLEESGDALEAAERGLDHGRVHLLGSYLNGAGARGVRTVYKSIGSPEQDLVLAHAVLSSVDGNSHSRVIDSLTAIKRNL